MSPIKENQKTNHTTFKEIRMIAIQSPFISGDNDDIIELPVNMSARNIFTTGIVYYNNYSPVYIPIDGTRLSIEGMDNDAHNNIGDISQLILKYRLGKKEKIALNVSPNDAYFIRDYKVIIVKTNNTYRVKFFVYPIWISEKKGYSLKFYLMNLDRNILDEITDLVKLHKTSQPFNPLKYNKTQQLTYTVNLMDVSPAFISYIHTQTFSLLLLSNPIDIASTPWEVCNENIATPITYGQCISAFKVPDTDNKITIANGCGLVDEWLECTYIKTMPLVNTTNELCPIPPTHIEVRYGGESIIKSIKEYNSVFEFTKPVELYGNIEVIFLKVINGGYFNLAIACMTVR